MVAEQWRDDRYACDAWVRGKSRAGATAPSFIGLFADVDEWIRCRNPPGSEPRRLGVFSARNTGTGFGILFGRGVGRGTRGGAFG
jgi:hypothetical protein